MSRRDWTRVGVIALVASAMSGAYWFHAVSGIEWEPEALRARAAQAGAMAPLFFVSLLALRPFLLLPSSVLMAASGAIFGTLGGTVWSTVGTTVGALIIFAIARVLGREAIESRLSGGVARIDRYLGRRGPMWLAGLTALPSTPLTPVYAAAGLSSMRPLPFLFATVAGLIPRAALLSYFGSSLLQLDAPHLWTASVLLLAALLVALVLRRRLAR